MTAPTAMRPAGPPPKTPAGVRMSAVWRGPRGLVDGRVEVPVDKDMRIAGHLWLCQREDCPTVVWVFGPDPTAAPEQTCCARHPLQLVPAEIKADEPDLIAAARTRTQGRLREMYETRKARMVDAARAKADMLRAAALREGRRTVRDMRGHLPSAAVSVTGLLAGIYVTATAGPVVAAAAGVAVGGIGAVAAYLAVVAAERWQARNVGVVFVGKAANRVRRKARHIASGLLALGVWLTTSAVFGADPTTMGGDFMLLLGLALVWAVNRRHWETLWETRRRLAELARLKAEEAARRAAEEAARLAALANSRPPLTVTDDVLEVGRRMAAVWAQMSRLDTVPAGFPMGRTWIVAEETREVTAPIDGEVTRIGYEFAIQAEPGALVSRMGSLQPPLVAAREWLASVLERDPSTVSLVDRPGNQPNRGLLLLTDSAPLGGTVAWKGRTGVRTAADGTIWVHAGRSITGEDVEKAAYIPGQPTGGLKVGHTGGGKSASVIVDILNDLVAGIFTTLDDPKQLVDYADFIGIIPISVTIEQRDVVLNALHAERRRRERHLAARPLLDRHGRTRTQQALWNVTTDGPPIFHRWEEFHIHARDQKFVGSLTELFRLQRVSAMSGDVITQGGGLADFADSVLRGLLNQTGMTLFRMPNNLAQLAGYTGTYMPSELPRLPGMCLRVAEGAPPVPLRTAFVTRADVDGSVYDQLYAPDGTPLLTAPPLPKETVEVFEREGLMDVWRLGQGANGMERLLSATNTPDAPTFADQQVQTSGAGQKLLAADMILGIVLSLSKSERPCLRADVDGHEGWRTAGWTSDPAPSTVTRAADQLEAGGLLVRDKSGWRVAPKGEARAMQALAVMLMTSGSAAKTAAEVEREQELADEAKVVSA